MKDIIVEVEGLSDIATNVETSLILSGLKYTMFYDPSTKTFSFAVKGPNGECYSIICSACEEEKKEWEKSMTPRTYHKTN